MKKVLLLFLMVSSISLFCNAQEKWSPLLPDYAKLQYAGAIGFLSAGAGYDLGKKNKLTGDLYYGFVPESLGGVDIHIITAKINWHPVKRMYDAGELKVNWLNAGAHLSYTLGRQYHLFSRASYSFSYYGFPTAGALSAFIGSGVEYKKFGAYYELGMTDRDAISLVSSIGHLKLTQALNMGIGIYYKLSH